MNNLGEPIKQFNPSIRAAAVQFSTKVASQTLPNLDFSDTQIAFAQKSDEELKKMAWLFGLMNKPLLVKIGSKLGLKAVSWQLPFAETVVKSTIFQQFCSGTTLLDSQKSIDRLYTHGVFSILDYGVEAKEREEDFNITMNEVIRGIDFASNNASVPVVSTKVTGMARFALLEKISSGQTLTAEEEKEYSNLKKRIDSICYVARYRQVALFIDAEETWIQPAIDELVEAMMMRYNTERPTVYGTYQMYRKDRLNYLVDSYAKAKKNNYILGAKLVRGAYMDKERRRAKEMGYNSPIQPDKQSTDKDFNKAVQFCITHYEQIASCNASHNRTSCELQVKLIDEKNIPRNHPHVNFCQLYGMSDHLTFNLAAAGFNVGKYLVYGPVREVLPYLVRRAEENTAVTGDMSREYSLVMQEMKRRGLA